MRDIVAEKCDIVLTTCLRYLAFIYNKGARSLLVVCSIANKFSEDVLVDELLHDTFTSLHLILLLVGLVAATAIGLLRVVAATLG